MRALRSARLEREKKGSELAGERSASQGRLSCTGAPLGAWQQSATCISNAPALQEQVKAVRPSAKGSACGHAQHVGAWSGGVVGWSGWVGGVGLEGPESGGAPGWASTLALLPHLTLSRRLPHAHIECP